jgi:hypothetical protein
MSNPQWPVTCWRFQSCLALKSFRPWAFLSSQWTRTASEPKHHWCRTKPIEDIEVEMKVRAHRRKPKSPCGRAWDAKLPQKLLHPNLAFSGCYMVLPYYQKKRYHKNQGLQRRLPGYPATPVKPQLLCEAAPTVLGRRSCETMASGTPGLAEETLQLSLSERM